MYRASFAYLIRPLRTTQVRQDVSVNCWPPDPVICISCAQTRIHVNLDKDLFFPEAGELPPYSYRTGSDDDSVSEYDSFCIQHYPRAMLSREAAIQRYSPTVFRR